METKYLVIRSILSALRDCFLANIILMMVTNYVAVDIQATLLIIFIVSMYQRGNWYEANQYILPSLLWNLFVCGIYQQAKTQLGIHVTLKQRVNKYGETVMATDVGPWSAILVDLAIFAVDYFSYHAQMKRTEQEQLKELMKEMKKQQKQQESKQE